VRGDGRCVFGCTLTLARLRCAAVRGSNAVGFVGRGLAARRAPLHKLEVAGYHDDRSPPLRDLVRRGRTPPPRARRVSLWRAAAPPADGEKYAVMNTEMSFSKTAPLAPTRTTESRGQFGRTQRGQFGRALTACQENMILRRRLK
jgi:hypothetical protein